MHLWPHSVRLGTVDDTLQALHAPPLAPSRFAVELRKRGCFGGEQEYDRLARAYKDCIVGGFSGLTRLVLTRRSWQDKQICELSATLKEVGCPSAEITVGIVSRRG